MTDSESEGKQATPQTSHHHVAEIQTVERQVGTHVLSALREEEAVAAITTLVPGVRHDRVVSIPLNKEQVEAIRGVLEQAEAEAAEDEDETEGRREGFLGFHTVLRLEGDVENAADETAS